MESSSARKNDSLAIDRSPDPSVVELLQEVIRDLEWVRAELCRIAQWVSKLESND